MTNCPASAGFPHPEYTTLDSPRFLAFLAAQFLGALNDNAFKVTIVMLVLATVADPSAQVRYSSTATAIFPIPFLLFSPIAGYIADRFPKHRVLLLAKAPEMVAMALGTLAFRAGSLPFLLCVLFLMALHSAFFSPAKYGIFPEVFDNKDLSLANGILEMTTNLAILIGSVVGVVVYGVFKDNLTGAGLTYFAIACAGTLSICFAPRAPAGNPQARLAWNVLDSVRGDYAQVKGNPYLVYPLLGLAYFGFLGSFFLTVIPIFAKNSLGLGEQAAGLLLAVLSIGVGLGAVFAGRLSRGHVELGLVPLGSVGISLFAFDLARFGGGSLWRPLGIPERAAFDLFMLGIAAGMFSIPLSALLQQRSPEGMKGRVIAFSNVLTFSAVLLAAAVLWFLTSLLGLSTHHVIVAVALVTVAGTLFALRLLPDFFVRLVLWLLTNTVYRVRVVGAENIPREGALLVANHVSWVDFMLISAGCDRVIRFLMYRPFYEWKALHWLFRRLHVIPVAAGDSPEKKEQSLSIARAEIAQGHTVCIFAEGAITRTGNLLKFKRGLEHIAAGVKCPIVPVWLDGVWGSLFSFERGKFFLKWPKRFFARVTVIYGTPLPPTATAFEVRQKVQELAADAFVMRKSQRRPVHVEFLSAARRRWWKRFLVEPSRPTLRFGQTVLRSLALRDALFATGRGETEYVGVLLPPGIDAVLVNVATWMAGKIPVNLDATPPGEFARTKIARGGFRTVVTRREFRERIGIGDDLAGARRIDLEDVPAHASRATNLLRALACIVFPSALGARLFFYGNRRDVDAVATVLYSYPRESPETPTGAMLTHSNLISNLESLRQVFRVTGDDVILNLLPLSHALGFTATFVLPAVAGIRVAFAADVADSDALGELCASEQITLLPVSPALLAPLMRHVRPEQLRRLRFVAVGGGELTQEARREFAARFGIEPYEGYGCPECAPIVSLNIPNFGHGKDGQLGTRLGSTGHPLPGISVRIVDPATGAALPNRTPGLLLIKGANVMQGYLNDAERTRRALVEGWYNTGDFAHLDDDGFITILPSPGSPPLPEDAAVAPQAQSR